MKPNLLSSLLLSALLAAAPVAAETPATSAAGEGAKQATAPVTIQALVIALPHTEAIPFGNSVDIPGKPAEAFAALQKLVAEKKAIAIGNLSVTTASGQRAVTDSGKRSLEVQIDISPGGKTAEVHLVVKDDSHRIITSIVMDLPSIRFVGIMESPVDPTWTEYVFARVSQ
jgi:hypothetical protein